MCCKCTCAAHCLAFTVSPPDPPPPTMMYAASVLVHRTVLHSLSPPLTPTTLTFLSLPGTRVPMALFLLSHISCSHQPFLSCANHFPLHCFSTTFPFSTAHISHKDGEYILQKHSHSTRSPFVTSLSRHAQSGRWSPFGKRVWFTESHSFNYYFFLVVLFTQFIVDNNGKKKVCYIKLNN